MTENAIAFLLGVVIAVPAALVIQALVRRHMLARQGGRLPLATEESALSDPLLAQAAARQHALEQRLEKEQHRLDAVLADRERFVDELGRVKAALTLADAQASENARRLDEAGMAADSLRIELAALRTRLAASEEREREARRDHDRAMDEIARRDERLTSQASDLLQQDADLARFSARLLALEHELRHVTSVAGSANAERQELEERCASLAAEIRRKDAVLDEQGARLVMAVGREAELTALLAKIRRMGFQPPDHTDEDDRPAMVAGFRPE